MVIFHSYVSLPEGNVPCRVDTKLSFVDVSYIIMLDMLDMFNTVCTCGGSFCVQSPSTGSEEISGALPYLHVNATQLLDMSIISVKKHCLLETTWPFHAVIHHGLMFHIA